MTAKNTGSVALFGDDLQQGFENMTDSITESYKHIEPYKDQKLH